MSAGGMGGGKKGPNADLNLVPFIDLLSTLIVFLLITAVWQQISVLSTNSASTTSSESATPPDPNKVELSVSLLLDHIEASEGKVSTKIPHVGVEPDYGSLIKLLTQWKERYPTKSDVVLHTDSQAPYKHLIRLMDTMVEAKFDDVGVNTN